MARISMGYLKRLSLIVFGVGFAGLIHLGCVGVPSNAKNPYISPQQTFAIHLPLSTHPYRFIEITNNPASPFAYYDQVDFQDAYGLLMGVRVGKISDEKRTASHDEIIQGIFKSIPAEVKENGQVRKLEKDIIPSKFGNMVLLTKGPYEIENGFGYEMTGIFPFQGLIYDFYAQCYPFCRTPDIAKSDAIEQFSRFYGNLTFFGEKGLAGAMSNKIDAVQVGR